MYVGISITVHYQHYTLLNYNYEEAKVPVWMTYGTEKTLLCQTPKWCQIQGGFGLQFCQDEHPGKKYEMAWTKLGTKVHILICKVRQRYEETVCNVTMTTVGHIM